MNFRRFEKPHVISGLPFRQQVPGKPQPPTSDAHRGHEPVGGAIVLASRLVSSLAPPQRGSARMGARPSGSWRASTVLRPRIGTMNHAESPSPALRAPSPPVGERDGVRGFASWRGALQRNQRVSSPQPSLPSDAGEGVASVAALPRWVFVVIPSPLCVFVSL